LTVDIVGIGRRLFLGAGAAALGTGGAALLATPPLSPEEDATTTIGFDKVAKKFPILNTLRRSVGRTEITVGGINVGGSAVLLDSVGTLALTLHQVNDRRDDFMTISFLPERDRDLNYRDAKAVFIAQDEKTDVSYWQLLDPIVIEEYGLVPIRWGKLGNGERHKGSQLVTLGFPKVSSGALHASLHAINDYTAKAAVLGDRVTAVGDIKEVTADQYCKVNIDDPVGDGTSGGGAFDPQTGQFLGTVTSTSLIDAQITPADALWNGYIRLVTTAELYGYQTIKLLHRECDIGSVETPRSVSTHTLAPHL
jgi:hypothetical protein